MTLLEDALSELRCPRGCAAALTLAADALGCPQCGARYPRRGEVIDFVPELAGSRGASQRVMENPAVARIYEEHWRPWFTKLGGSLDYAQEEAWLREQHVVATPTPIQLLDLACGSGRYARLLERVFSPKLVFALDLSLPMLQVAAERARQEGRSRILFLRADAGSLPLRSASVDLLNCFGALHLFPEPARALDELGRVARQDARFTCLTAAWRDEPLPALLQRGFSRAASFRFFGHDELRAMLAHAGFSGFAPEQHGAILLFAARRAATAA